MAVLIRPSRGLFIVGSDTGVGKTCVAAAIARQLRSEGVCVGVYKPVASGATIVEGRSVSSDAVALWEAAGKPGRLDDVCPQLFAAPLAPHQAAAAEGKRVDAARLRTGAAVWRDTCELLLVEGAGGLMSPVTEQELVADLARDLGYPLVIVVANRIGAIGQALQTLIAARSVCPQLPVAALVLSGAVTADDDPSVLTNATEIAARISPIPTVQLPLNGTTFAPPFSWQAV